MFSDIDDWELNPPAPKTVVMQYKSDDRIKGQIERREFYAIPESKKSKPFADANPWPPPQFKCGRCGFAYDGLVPHHSCGSSDGYYPDVVIYDFCTHCGDSFNQYEGRHRCTPYGRHCRRVGLASPPAYFMRVWGVFTAGRHHFEWAKPLMYAWVESLTDRSQFRYVGSAQGIERAKLLIGKLPNNFGV